MNCGFVFDGKNFFATSHTVGSGNNIVTGTASGTDLVDSSISELNAANTACQNVKCAACPPIRN